MLTFTLRFPLGVYHALAPQPDRHGSAEWAPHPVRLVGALLAAAHEAPSDDVAADRTVLQRLCDAAPPTVIAPPAARWDAPNQASETAVAELRGPSRWAPRNPSASEAKALSPLMVGRTRTEVDKGGIAIGDRPVGIVWPDLDLTNGEVDRLRRMAGNVAWLGTSRSPVLITVGTSIDAALDDTPRWTPLPWNADHSDASLRVPDSDLLVQFDAAFAARRSAKGRLESAGNQQPAFAGTGHPYAIDIGAREGQVMDPAHWGRLTIVALDVDSTESGLPKAPSAYVLSRTFRAALLDAFDDRGGANDAPAVLHGRDDSPHVAFVPLPAVGHRHAKGTVLGFALVFPSESRCPDVARQVGAVHEALAQFFPAAGKTRRPIAVPRMGRLWVEPTAADDERRWTLNAARYTSPATTWVTATPVVLSRWPKGRDRDTALVEQVAADCGHVGLPEPAAIEVLRSTGAHGGAARLLPPVGELPPDWRKSLTGPTVHLRIRFDAPVRGPVLLGRARHFGVGLLVPERSEQP